MTMHETSRRDVLRGGALGVGALVGASGAMSLANEATAATYDPRVTTGQQFWLTMNGVTGDGTGDFKNKVRVLTFTIDFDTNSDGVRTTTPLSFTTPTGSATIGFLARLGFPPATKPVYLIGFRPGAKGLEPYLYLTLQGAQVSAVHTAAHGLPVDSVVLGYSKISYMINGNEVTF